MRTKKPKPIETRRHRALRYTAILVVLLAYMTVADGYKLLPGQAVRYTEETYNLKRTEIVTRLLPPREMKLFPAAVYLSGNDNALLLSGVRFNLLYGWMDFGGSPLDCSRPAPIHVGAWLASRRVGDGEAIYPQADYLFGRVDDPAVAEVRVRLCWREYTDDPPEYFTDQVITISAGDMLERGGVRYFVVPYAPEEQAFQEGHDSRIYYFCDAVDGEGKVLYTQPEENTGVTWTSIG